MKVLGFRGDPKAPRYAIVSKDDGDFTLENASDDSKLTVPASIGDEADAERVDWVYHEILRILDEHTDISKVVLKQNEFTRQDTLAKRRSAYNDAAVLLACSLRSVPVEIKLYTSLSTTSSDTKSHAESRVGRTDKYWDTKMADAVNAAWWGLRH